MELEQKMLIPFFSFITPSNCDDLGIPDYFEKVPAPMTLSIIKVKLENKEYRSLVELTGDFRAMFANVAIYYTRESDEFKKAEELKLTLERRRKSNAKRLKW